MDWTFQVDKIIKIADSYKNFNFFKVSFTIEIYKCFIIYINISMKFFTSCWPALFIICTCTLRHEDRFANCGGTFRYMPPVTPSLWRNTRLADRFGAVCPQRPPDIGNRSEALLEFPRGRLLYLEKLLPLLANQSEDCLYLNLYVPRTGE